MKKILLATLILGISFTSFAKTIYHTQDETFMKDVKVNESFAQGDSSTATGENSVAIGYSANATNDNSFVFNGVSTNENYGSHDIDGTFNINPTNGIDGFYIGDKTLGQILGGLDAGVLSINETHSGAVTIEGGTHIDVSDTGTGIKLDTKNLPEPNNGILSITVNGNEPVEFSANQSGNSSVSINYPTNINELNDVEISNVDNGHFLRYDSGNWVNESVSIPAAANNKKLTIKTNNVIAVEFTADSAVDVERNIDIPTVNNGTLTITTNGTSAGSFTANQSDASNIQILIPTNLDNLSDVELSDNIQSNQALVYYIDIHDEEDETTGETITVTNSYWTNKSIVNSMNFTNRVDDDTRQIIGTLTVNGNETNLYIPKTSADVSWKSARPNEAVTWSNSIGQLIIGEGTNEVYIPYVVEYTKDKNTNYTAVAIGSRIEGSDVGVNSLTIGTNLVAAGDYSIVFGEYGHDPFSEDITFISYDSPKKWFLDVSGYDVNNFRVGDIIISTDSEDNVHTYRIDALHLDEPQYKIQLNKAFHTVANNNACSVLHGGIAHGRYSFVRGLENIANGDYSYADGNRTIANGDYSRVGGSYSEANGEYSIAFGNTAIANNDYTIALGYNPIATNDYSFVWNGDEEYGSYGDHDLGTFNINPVGGFDGFYICDENIRNGIERIITNTLKNSKLTLANSLGGYTNTITKNIISNPVYRIPMPDHPIEFYNINATPINPSKYEPNPGYAAVALWHTLSAYSGGHEQEFDVTAYPNTDDVEGKKLTIQGTSEEVETILDDIDIGYTLAHVIDENHSIFYEIVGMNHNSEKQLELDRVFDLVEGGTTTVTTFKGKGIYDSTNRLGLYSISFSQDGRGNSGRNYATGTGAFAHGSDTRAEGRFSHAEGIDTMVLTNGIPESPGESSGYIAMAAHADGVKAMSTNKYAYVWSGIDNEGYYGSHGIGTYSINPVGGLDGFWIGPHPLSFYIPDHPMFYVQDSNSNWTAISDGVRATENIVPNPQQVENFRVGPYSIAVGTNIMASGEGSLAIGSGNIDSDNNTNQFTVAGGTNAIAIGLGVRAMGDYSHAEGGYSVANEKYSMAFGDNVYSLAPGAIGFGRHSSATGEYAMVFGDNNVAGGTNALAIGGRYSKAIGDYSIAMGDHAEANGTNSIATGKFVEVNDHDSYAWNGIGSEEEPYVSNGEGTYNINPKDGLEGFYIGESNAYQIVFERLLNIITDKNYHQAENVDDLIANEKKLWDAIAEFADYNNIRSAPDLKGANELENRDGDEEPVEEEETGNDEETEDEPPSVGFTSQSSDVRDENGFLDTDPRYNRNESTNIVSLYTFYKWGNKFINFSKHPDKGYPHGGLSELGDADGWPASGQSADPQPGNNSVAEALYIKGRDSAYDTQSGAVSEIYDPLAGSSNFTIMAWIKRNENSSSTASRILADLSGTTSGLGFQLRFAGRTQYKVAGAEIQLYINNSSPDTSGVLYVNTNGKFAANITSDLIATTAVDHVILTPTDPNWYHIAIARKQQANGNDHIRYFVNGFLVREVNKTSFMGVVGTNKASLWLGCASGGNTDDGQLKGYVDDVIIFRGWTPSALIQSDNRNKDVAYWMDIDDQAFEPPAITDPVPFGQFDPTITIYSAQQIDDRLAGRSVDPSTIKTFGQTSTNVTIYTSEQFDIKHPQ